MRGFCSKCEVPLVEDNCCPSIFKRGTGKCHTCDNVRCGLRYKENPEKFNQRGKKWIRDNPEKRKKISRNQVSRYRKRKFGITEEEFNLKFQLQKGLCEICKQLMSRDIPRRRPCQDHNHATNKLRDLLCSSCNLLLGNCFEDIDILASAIKYLQKHADGSSTQTVCVGGAELCSAAP